MRIFSYIIMHDTGFAPNPFWNYCTLANCKPPIRRTANVGDWVVGINSKSKGNLLVYAMKIDEILSYSEYFTDSRFASKIPSYDLEIVNKCGDNIYKPLPNGDYSQLCSMHSCGKNENQTNKVKDLNGRKILIAKRYYYFGSDAVNLPENLKELITGRGYKCRFSSQTIEHFISFIEGFSPGIHAKPSRWKDNDESWRTSNR